MSANNVRLMEHNNSQWLYSEFAARQATATITCDRQGYIITEESL